MKILNDINDVHRMENPGRDPQIRPRSAPNTTSYAWLIQDLESVRKLVVERLASIETLARERPATGKTMQEIAELEESFKKKFAELEETRRRLLDEAEQEQREWTASLSQLDDDRRLLAEAWEQLERERVGSPAAARETPASHVHGHTPPMNSGTAYTHPTHANPVRSAAIDSDSRNPVAQAILRQFQTLQSDVRRSARGGRATQ
jgi:hypothetical protein